MIASTNKMEIKMEYSELRLMINSTVCDAESYNAAVEMMEFSFSNRNITWEEYEEIEGLLKSKITRFNI